MSKYVVYFEHRGRKQTREMLAPTCAEAGHIVLTKNPGAEVLAVAERQEEGLLVVRGAVPDSLIGPEDTILNPDASPAPNPSGASGSRSGSRGLSEAADYHQALALLLKWVGGGYVALILLAGVLLAIQMGEAGGGTFFWFGGISVWAFAPLGFIMMGLGAVISLLDARNDPERVRH